MTVEVKTWATAEWAPQVASFIGEALPTTARLWSKAGWTSEVRHDAAYIARVAPTTMIFVPCLGGISHNESESTTFDECAAGAQSREQLPGGTLAAARDGRSAEASTQAGEHGL